MSRRSRGCSCTWQAMHHHTKPEATPLSMVAMSLFRVAKISTIPRKQRCIQILCASCLLFQHTRILVDYQPLYLCPKSFLYRIYHFQGWTQRNTLDVEVEDLMVLSFILQSGMGGQNHSSPQRALLVTGLLRDSIH